MSVAIRKASTADVTKLSATGRRLFTQAYGSLSDAKDLAAHVDDFFSESAVAGELAKDQVTYLMAVEGGEIAGFAKFRRGETPAAVPAAGAIELQQLYVDGNRQRKGIGRQLVDEVRARARPDRDEGIWLSVWQEADWAIRFYEACGFRPVGEVNFRLGRTLYRDFLMWLPLRGSNRD